MDVGDVCHHSKMTIPTLVKMGVVCLIMFISKWVWFMYRRLKSTLILYTVCSWCWNVPVVYDSLILWHANMLSLKQLYTRNVFDKTTSICNVCIIQ